MLKVIGYKPTTKMFIFELGDHKEKLAMTKKQSKEVLKLAEKKSKKKIPLSFSGPIIEKIYSTN